MSNLQIELNEKYRESLDLLKQIVPNKDGKQINKDSEMVEVLIDEFIGFLKQSANQNNGSCCGGGEGKGGCGCHG